MKACPNVSCFFLQELCSAFEVKEELYQELMNKGHQLLAITPEGPDSNTEQDLGNLKEKWEAVQGKAAERKVWSKKLWSSYSALSLIIHNLSFRWHGAIADILLSYDCVSKPLIPVLVMNGVRAVRWQGHRVWLHCGSQQATYWITTVVLFTMYSQHSSR